MAKGLSPIIGLAVVMALALAAVFGSMSLANPAMAAIGQPADAELTERTFAPQDATIEVNVGATENVNIASLITGGGENFDSAAATAVPTTVATVGAVTTGFNTVNVPITGVAPGTARISVRVVLDVGDPETLRIDVTVVAATPASAKGEIPEMNVVVGDGTNEGTSSTFDATQYFEAGKGTGGAITGYTIVSSDATAVVARINNTAAAEDFGEVTLAATADTGGVGDFSLVTVTAADGNDGEANPTQSFFVTVVSATEEVGDMPTVTPSSRDPGENTKYTVKFAAGDNLTTGVDEITVELTDFDVPSSVDASSVTVSVTGMYDGDGRSCTTVDTDAGGCRAERTFTNDAAAVSIDGEKVIIDLKVRSDDFVDIIKKGDPVTVVIGQSAGISNPTEAKGYDEVEVNSVVAEDVEINLKLSLSEDEGGRNDTITVTGKGFKNGTTMTAYRLTGGTAGFTGAQSLCSGTVGSDDVGKCEFTVTSPLFKSGSNFINVKDGRNQSVDAAKDFILEPSIAVTPEGASVGDSVQVQMYDFISGSTVQGVRIARLYLCMKSGEPISLMTSCSDGVGYSNWTPGGSSSALGEQSFNVSIPDGAPQGSQELRVETSSENDSTNIVITGPVITTTPTTVLANQRVSLTGSGFTSGSEIDVITFAGEVIPAANIQGGQDVSVDNGGNWSASVVLPMTNSTTSAGEHAIKVADTMGRGGEVKVTVPERKVTITPDTGRVGSVAVVRGENFPSKNDDGEAFSISIEYSASNGKTTSTTVPDASGRFEQQITVPTTANIPSTNSVTVSFTTSAGTKVPLLVNHNVPEGAIDLSDTSGGPGSTIMISGEGFKAFVPVSSVKVGSIEVTPSPRPSTDAQGMMEFTITVPGLDVGIQTIEVMVGGTTASIGFTVTESGVNPGDIRPTAEAIEPLGGNLMSVWHFNNDTKVWAFYDPTLAEGNTLTFMITGETYLIRIQSDQEVILNRDTRNLTCLGANCWNQVVW